MTEVRVWPTPDDAVLITDLYELAMMQAYWSEGMHGHATFSLYFRELPPERNFMLACGQQHAARLIAGLRFGRDALDRLAGLPMFREGFLRWLEGFRFSGDVDALPEGTPVFPHEPLLEVTAPVAEAQLLESLLMNLVHLETVLASKAVRLVLAARSRPVVDFGLRRMHGLDAAVQGVRAYRTAGIDGTSNVFGGLRHDLPLRGTMAHSFVQAHADEAEAFVAYARLYPGTTLLVDTYDSLAAVDRVIELKREHGDGFEVGAIRLDSGDLAALARAARQRLDAAGLEAVRIFASGGLDEHRIAELLDAGAPIDGFGVGTALGTASDSPSLDLVYKLTEYDGEPRLKTSPGKAILPGAKQVYRYADASGCLINDEVTLRAETRDAEALLAPVVRGGEPVAGSVRDADATAAYAADQVRRLPDALRELRAPERPYPVRISGALQALLRNRVSPGSTAP